MKNEALRSLKTITLVLSIGLFLFFCSPADASTINIPILSDRTGGINNTENKGNPGTPTWAKTVAGNSYTTPTWNEGNWYVDVRGLNPYWYDWRYYASFYSYAYLGADPEINSASITFTAGATGGIAPLWNIRLYLSSDTLLTPPNPADARDLHKSCGNTPISDDIFSLAELTGDFTFTLNTFGLAELASSTGSFTVCIREVQYDVLGNDPAPYNETYSAIYGAGANEPFLTVDWNPTFPEIGGYEYGMGTIGYPLTLMCPVGQTCKIPFDYSVRDAGTDVYLVPYFPTPCVPENAVSSTTMPFFTGQAEMSVPTSTEATSTRYCLYFDIVDGTAGIDNNFKVVWYATSSINYPTVNDPFCQCTATTTLDSIFCGLKKISCWLIIPPDEVNSKLAEAQGKLSRAFPFSSFSDLKDKFKEWESLSTNTDETITIHIGENNGSALDQFNFVLISSSTLEKGIGSTTKTMIESSVDFILYFLACLYIFLRILFVH